LLDIVQPADLNSGESLDLWFGLVPAATAALGSSGNLFDSFLGLRSNSNLQNFNNSTSNIKYFWYGSDTGNFSQTSGSTSGVTQPTRGAAGAWPIGVKLAFVGQNMIGYLMDPGSSVWTQIFSHAFSSAALPGLRFCIGMQTASPNTIGQRLSFTSVTSTVPA
jgi:hypothetical protein